MRGTLPLFQDLSIPPTLTDKETGLIKAEVPYTDYKILKQAMVTVLLGIFATPYWVSTDSANMTFTSWVRPLNESMVFPGQRWTQKSQKPYVLQGFLALCGLTWIREEWGGVYQTDCLFY